MLAILITYPDLSESQQALIADIPRGTFRRIAGTLRANGAVDRKWTEISGFLDSENPDTKRDTKEKRTGGVDKKWTGVKSDEKVVSKVVSKKPMDKGPRLFSEQANGQGDNNISIKSNNKSNNIKKDKSLTPPKSKKKDPTPAGDFLRWWKRKYTEVRGNPPDLKKGEVINIHRSFNRVNKIHDMVAIKKVAWGYLNARFKDEQEAKSWAGRPLHLLFKHWDRWFEWIEKVGKIQKQRGPVADSGTLNDAKSLLEDS